MKYLILVLSAVSIPAFATDVCASAWVFKPYKTCATAANGLDLSVPGEATNVNLNSPWTSGNVNRERICQDVATGFNEQNLGKGLFAQVLGPEPLGADNGRLVQQEVRISCNIHVRKYPFKTAPNADCGTENKISYQVGGSAETLAGEGITCLSCDNVADDTTKVNCLRQNIERIVEPRAIDLRESDLRAISAQASALLKRNEQSPIENLRSKDQRKLLQDFVAKHPVQNDSIGGSGHGSLPTLQ